MCKVVERGALAAPGFTEALLHEQLRQDPGDSQQVQQVSTWPQKIGALSEEAKILPSASCTRTAVAS